MTQSGFEQKRSSFSLIIHPRQILPGLTAGLIAGIITIVVEISFAALIFSGNLSSFVTSGIGFTLFGAFIIILVTTFTSSFPGILAFPQDTPAVLLALVAAGISFSMPASATAEETYLTVVVSIVLTSLLAGGFFLALGLLKLGRLIRFIPYPVIGGFLAGTGWLLFKGGLGVMTDTSLTLSQFPYFFKINVLIKWLPGLVFAGILLITLRRYKHFTIMPAIVLTATGLFYLFTWLTNTSISEVATQGWLLDLLHDEKLWRPIQLSILSKVHWESIWRQFGNIGIILLISAIAMLLNVNGLELISKQDMDLNRELKVAGFANLVAGIGGSPVGYHTLSLSALGFKIGSNCRLVGLISAILCAVALWFGASLVSIFPKFVLGGLISFLGLSFLIEWIYDAWFKVSKIDYFLVILILIVIGTFGFLEGVGVGILVAVLIFIVNYSRIKVINRTLSGITQQSNVDRPSYQRQLLREKGNQFYIFKLQGFIFFGTAHTLYQDVCRRIYDKLLPPLRYIIFDFHRVTGLDGSAEIAFIKILRLAHSYSVHLVFTDLSSQFQRKLRRAFSRESSTKEIHFFPDTDHGVEWCEDQILICEHAQMKESPQPLQKLLQSIFSQPDQIERLITYLQKKEVNRGCYLIKQGEPAQHLYFIESGEFAAQLEIQDEEPIRLRTMRAGAIFGEIALYLNIPRSVSIVATKSSTVYQLSMTALKEMETKDPHLAIAFQNYVIRLLSERLVDLNRTLEALAE